MRKIGILTGGGDCPGLNAVIRGIVEKCARAGIETVGLREGWRGAIDADAVSLTLKDVEGLQTKGGTILGSSRTNVMKMEGGPEKVRTAMNKLGLEGIVAIGGDDTLGVASKLNQMGMPMIGVPKTIDNDLSCTDFTFGFDTSANIVMEAIDRLTTTADSHGRIMVVEIMGRHTGWIAVQGGIAGNAHIILIPEFPKTLEEIEEVILKRKAEGQRCTVIAVAEGFALKGYERCNLPKDAFGNVCLPDQEIGKTLAKMLEQRTGIESRYVVLGHLQRGGSPSAFDRVLSLRMGAKAGDLVIQKKYGYMVALSATKIIEVDLDKAVSERKKVDQELYEVAELLAR